MAKKEEKKPSEEKAKGFPPAEADEKKGAPAAQDSKENSDGKESAPESAQDKPDKASEDERHRTVPCPFLKGLDFSDRKAIIILTYKECVRDKPYDRRQPAKR